MLDWMVFFCAGGRLNKIELVEPRGDRALAERVGKMRGQPRVRRARNGQETLVARMQEEQVEHLHLAEIAGWEVEVRKEQQEMKKTVGQCRLCCPQPVGEVQQLVAEAE